MPRRLLFPLSLLALIVAVFWPVAGFDFQRYDDGYNVYNNWRVTNFSAANLFSFWRAPYDSLYIPVTYDVWGVLARLSTFFSPGPGGVAPSYFHVANLLVHLANALLVLKILRSLKVEGWAAWGGALLFALHPVQVEAVAWVTGMKDLLSGFFSLLAVWQYLRFTQAETDGENHWPPYLLTGLALVLAMLAKPGAVAAPLLLLIIGRLLVAREWRQLARELLPLAALAGPIIVLTKFAQPNSHLAWEPDIWQRLLVGGNAFVLYLGKLVLPTLLTPDSGLTPQVVLAGWPWVYLAALVGPLFYGLLWRWARGWLAPALLFGAALLPVSGLVLFDFQQISTVAERYLYLAMLGPALAVGWGLRRFPGKRGWLLFLIVISLLAAKAASQVWVWENSETLSTHTVRLNPKSWVAHNNLGIIKAEKGLDNEATAAFAASLVANPDYADAHHNLGAHYLHLGREQEGEEQLRRALELNPASHKSAFYLAELKAKQASYEVAIAYYRQALAAKPDFLEGYNNLGLLFLQLQRPQEALTLYRQALVSCQEHPLLYYNLARAQAQLGDIRGSVAALLKAIALDPGFAPAYRQLASAYRQLGDETSARRYADGAKALGS